MTGFAHVNVKYPIGLSRWSNIPDEEFNNNRSGGCNTNTKDFKKYEKLNINKFVDGIENSIGKFYFKVINYKSKNNNCGLICLIKGSGKNGNQLKPDTIRKKYNIEKNTLLTCDQLGIISCEELKYNLLVFNSKSNLLYKSNSTFEKSIFLLLEDIHYKLINVKDVKIKQKCKFCGKKYIDNNHECNSRRREYFLSKIKKQKKYVILNDIKINKDGKKIKEIDYDNDILYFDFETFEDNGNFSVYAAAYILNGNYDYFYGRNALQDFIGILLDNKNKKLCAYNGGRFDYLLLIRGLIENNIDIFKIFLFSDDIL